MIALGSDHAGFKLKEDIKAHLGRGRKDVYDFGVTDEQPSDYPDIAVRVAKGVSQGKFERGVLVCGSGVGMSIAANRIRNVRAALCRDEETARMSRVHNDSNILVLGARFTTTDAAIRILEAWLDASFEGGRHERRVKKIDGEAT